MKAYRWKRTLAKDAVPALAVPRRRNSALRKSAEQKMILMTAFGGHLIGETELRWGTGWLPKGPKGTDEAITNRRGEDSRPSTTLMQPSALQCPHPLSASLRKHLRNSKLRRTKRHGKKLH